MAAVCFGTDTYECDFATVNATMESYFRMTCDQAPPKPPWFIYLGIGLGCFGSVGINLGNNLQAVGINLDNSDAIEHVEELEKKGHDIDNEELPKMKGGCSKGTFIFAIGSTIFFTASLVNFAAFTFAPGAVLAPLEAIQVVCQLFCGRIFHKTPITTLSAASTVLTVLGVVCAIAAVPTPERTKITIPDLISYWNDPIWVVYLCIVLIAAAIMQTTHVIYRRAEMAGQPKWNSKAITPVTYAGAAAIVGALSVAQAKAIAEIFTLLMPPCLINIFIEPFFWMVLFLLGSAGGIWLNRSIAALGLYNPNFIIPLLQSNYIAFATISAGVYFQEFSTMSRDVWRWPVFAGGLSTMLLGLYGLFRAGQAQEAKKAAEPPSSPHPKSIPIGSGLAVVAIDEASSISVMADAASSPEASVATPVAAPEPAAAAEWSVQSAPAAIAGAPTPILTPGELGSGRADSVESMASVGSVGSRSRISFAEGSLQTPSGTQRRSSASGNNTYSPHPHSLRERSSSRSRMELERHRPALQRQMTTGSVAELIVQQRLSKALMRESLNGQEIRQSSGYFSRPSSTPGGGTSRASQKSASGSASSGLGSERGSFASSRRGSEDDQGAAAAAAAAATLRAAEAAARAQGERRGSAISPGGRGATPLAQPPAVESPVVEEKV